MNNMSLEEAINELKWLKHRYIDKDIKLLNEKELMAIDTVLTELDILQTNYILLEEKFDGSAEEKVDKLTVELGKLSQENEELKLRINDFLEEMRCIE